MAEPRPALGGASSGDRLQIRELPARPIRQVSAFHGRVDEAARALAIAGLRPPRGVGETVCDAGLTVLCVGPGRWWLVGDARATDLDPTLGSSVDQSHGRVILEIRGGGVRDLLAKGSSIDLHPTALPAGRCAATSLGPFAVVLHAGADDRFEIHVARSYARALVEWLEDAALEFESGPAT